ncbi:hypothetical protein Y032_0260g506 [Ancylostoma ceylanicum]|uniref:Uncharacterized protein n=1 Tax=Ancylostoma ceylanicum TaxID=53326 RepID=A0A016SAZ2_9BILA|nr:hypothetical protein Y032_0260g506 [Ancylostoma ceylanicum]
MLAFVQQKFVTSLVIFKAKKSQKRRRPRPGWSINANSCGRIRRRVPSHLTQKHRTQLTLLTEKQPLRVSGSVENDRTTSPAVRIEGNKFNGDNPSNPSMERPSPRDDEFVAMSDCTFIGRSPMRTSCVDASTYPS